MSKLHLVFANTRIGGAAVLQHTMRDESGSWAPLGNIMSQIGPIPGNNPNAPILIQDFACAVDGSNGDLHVVAVDQIGGVWHTIRTASKLGPWQAWGDVQAAVPSGVGNPNRLAIAFSPTQD
jgi:hypothetical protein